MELLLGVSQKMEKSLSAIEKGLSATAETSGKDVSILGSLASSINSITAAVTAKQFDPKKAESLLSFTKGLVQISTTVDVKKAEAFGKFATGVSSAFTSILDIVSPANALKLMIAEKYLLGGEKSVMKRIVGGMTKAIEDIDPVKVKKAGEAIAPLGNGLKALAEGMKSLVIVGLAAPLIALGALTARGVVWVFSELGEKAESIEAGGDAMKALGKGLVVFSAGMATLALMLLVVPPGKMIEGIAVIAAFALVFDVIGKAASSIHKGSKAMGQLGLGLLGFSIGLATYMLTMMIVTPETVLGGLATIAAFGVVFAILGKFEKTLAEGALILVGMSVALFLFSGGLMIYDIAMKNFDETRAALGVAIIAGFGVGLTFLGKYGKQIEEGGLVLAGMGVALGFFSAGLLVFDLALKFMDFEKAALGAAVIAGLGTAFALVGTMSVAVAPGILAMSGIGLSLLSIAGGILAFGLALSAIQHIFKGGMVEAGVQSAAIITGLGLAFGAVGLGAPFVLAGGVAMTSVGFALMSLGGGILVFGMALKAVEWLFSNEKGGTQGIPGIPGGSGVKAGMKGAAIILGLGGSFALLGLMSPAIALGAVAATLMGVTLLPFSLGLLAYAATLKFIGETDKFVKKTSIFLDLGWQFTKLAAYSLTAPIGAAVAISMGAALYSIAKGLEKAQEAISLLDSKTIGKLFDEKDGIVRQIATGFGNIGNAFGGDKFFGKVSQILGTDPVSRGISVSYRMGSVISELVGGIASLSDITNFPITVWENGKEVHKTINLLDSKEGIPAVICNFRDIVNEIAGMFADLGNNAAITGLPAGGSNIWAKMTTTSPVQKGVKAVAGMGAVVSELVGGIAAFANLKSFPITEYKDGKETKRNFDLEKELGQAGIVSLENGSSTGGSGILGNIASVVVSVASVFASIGKGMPGGLEKLVTGDSDVAKGIQAVTGMSSIVAEIGAGLTAFAQLKDADGKAVDVEKLKTKMGGIISALPVMFAKIDTKGLDKIDGTAKSLDRLAMAFQKIANVKSFDKFADSFKKLNTEIKSLNNDTIKAFEIWTKTMTDFAQIDPEKFQGVVKVTGNLLDTSFKQGQSADKTADVTTTEGKNSIASAVAKTPTETPTKADKNKPAPITHADLEAVTRSIMMLQTSIDDLTNKFTKGTNGGILISER